MSLRPDIPDARVHFLYPNLVILVLAYALRNAAE